MDPGSPSRDILLDPAMQDSAGDVRGLRVCDVGCGEGRFSRLLAARGAVVTGLDPTRLLLEVARRRYPASEYVQAVAESIPFPNGQFDLVVSYLSLIDIPDFRTGIREMARILRLGGALIVANLSSHATANTGGWSLGVNGEKTHFSIDRYLQQRFDLVSWDGIEVINYHRPRSDYMQAFLDSDLNLETFFEPRYTEEAVSANPSLAFDNRIGFFVVMRWRKTGSPYKARLREIENAIET